MSGKSQTFRLSGSESALYHHLHNFLFDYVSMCVVGVFCVKAALFPFELKLLWLILCSLSVTHCLPGKTKAMSA